MNEQLERVVRGVLSNRRSDHFADGFADRALARWNAARAQRASLDTLLTREFRRSLPWAVAATMLLAAWNVKHGRSDSAQSTVGALLGLAPPRAITADQLYRDLYGDVYEIGARVPEGS